MYIQIGILACIGALIGWITNILAIKLLFRPMNPIVLPFGLKIQGVLPRRKEEIARSLGEVVEKELLSTSEILGSVLENTDMKDVKEKLSQKLGQVAMQKLPPLLLSLAGGSIQTLIDKFLEGDGEAMIKEFVSEAAHKAGGKIKLADMVEEKINSYDFVVFEEMIIALVKKELRHIEILGAVLGFVIGIIQGVVILLF